MSGTDTILEVNLNVVQMRVCQPRGVFSICVIYLHLYVLNLNMPNYKVEVQRSLSYRDAHVFSLIVLIGEAS